MTDWKTWPKCVFFFFCFVFVLFCFFFSWAADASNLIRSQVYSVWNMELDLWMNKIQERIQELKTSVVQSISLCLTCIFVYILTSKFIKTWKKIKQAKKIERSNFAELNAHQKTNARGSFETYNLFFQPKAKKKTSLFPVGRAHFVSP